MPAPTIPYRLERLTPQEQMARADALFGRLKTRRSVRQFSDRPVPRELIERLLDIAHGAPSGANRKPWRFVAIDDPQMKQEIRLAAEEEEKKSYEHRFPPEWLDALEPFGTDWHKPYLEVVPWLVVVFRIDWEMHGDKKLPNYYPNESTGLACGFFLAACHEAGLATLTHTPNPMAFLREICRRPVNEKPYLLIPVGYPADDAVVPDIAKKPLAERMQWNR